MNINTKFFGKIALGADKDGYFENHKITVNNKNYDVALVFLSIDEVAYKDEILNFIDNIDKLDIAARKAIANDYENDGDALFYAENIVEALGELNDADLMREANLPVMDSYTDEYVLKNLTLAGFTVYEDEEYGIACFLDYSISPEITDDLLAVTFDKDLKFVNSVTPES